MESMVRSIASQYSTAVGRACFVCKAFSGKIEVSSLSESIDVRFVTAWIAFGFSSGAPQIGLLQIRHTSRLLNVGCCRTRAFTRSGPPIAIFASHATGALDGTAGA